MKALRELAKGLDIKIIAATQMPRNGFYVPSEPHNGIIFIDYCGLIKPPKRVKPAPVGLGD